MIGWWQRGLDPGCQNEKPTSPYIKGRLGAGEYRVASSPWVVRLNHRFEDFGEIFFFAQLVERKAVALVDFWYVLTPYQAVEKLL